MAKPLPCWGRERDPAPIDENPLLQWVNRRRENEPEHANRAAPCDMGRGRLMTNGPSTSSPDVSPSDGMGYASAYWRNQRGPIEPGLDISEPMHPVGPSTASEQLSGGRPSLVADLGSSPPSGLEHHVPSAAVPEMDPEMAAADPQSPSDPQARQGISRSWKVRHEELRRRNAEPWRSPPMSTLHGQPRVSQSQPRQRPLHVGDGTNKTAAGPACQLGGSSRNRGKAPARRTAKAPLREGRRAPRWRPSFDPSEIKLRFDLSAWRNSFSKPRATRPDDDDEESDELSDEEDDEDVPCRLRESSCAFSGRDSLESRTDLAGSSADSPASSSTVQPTTPFPTLPHTEEEPALTRFLEVRGLLKTEIPESIYDTVSSYTAIDDVEVFYADDGVVGRITLSEPRPITWICRIVEQAFSFEGGPKPLVFASVPTSTAVYSSEAEML